MDNKSLWKSLGLLAEKLEGKLLWDISTRLQYATDASAYREIPIAVCLPKTKKDIKILIEFGCKHSIPLTPRTAGTSLAGQVVGNGIVLDFSSHWGKILEVNQNEKWVRVEPGVILDELNAYLITMGLFFGPETSTSNRCMIGGMVANNSCGAHSLIYGSTRDHTISLQMMLYDGNEYEFKPISKNEFNEKLKNENPEGEAYRHIYNLLSNKQNRETIAKEFPDPTINRRNTGYALDLLLDNEIFSDNDKPFNFCKLIAGSEGTLGIITEIKLNLVPLPPKEKALICVHLHEREQAFKANLIALKYKPGAVELMDNLILDCTKENIEQQKNRFFIQSNPGAILIVEFARETRHEIEHIAAKMEEELRVLGYGYHFPIIWGDEISKVWALRKAGLGVLSNIKGDAKPVSLVEDTAVAVDVLPEYMADFAKIMAYHNLDCVYHAHIGSGELHLRPVLNLKDRKDVELFRTVAIEVAHLVKKYRGSLSGEHGDGRLRGELIPIMVGEKVYEFFKALKKTWDPNGIFNPQKIVDTPPINSNLRYQPGRNEPNINTFLSFADVEGVLRAVEKCNGSGDCRKTQNAGGTLCPSYMATRNEADTTRARANILREFLTNSTKKNPFNHKEIYDILDLCLMCKGCKNECPSNVDITKLKAEFLHQWYKSHAIPLRSRLIANILNIYSLGSFSPKLVNFFLKNIVIKGLMYLIGFAPQREFPKMSETSLRRWHKKNPQKSKSNKRVYLFADEFTNYTDAHIGIKAIQLLNSMDYDVKIADINNSGRAYISKGLLKTAQRIASRNVNKLHSHISGKTPLIGIEPSAILSFRDEYPDLVKKEDRTKALGIANNCLLFDEFFMREAELGNIKKDWFNNSSRAIKLHGHCQQKAVASTKATLAMLSFPSGHSVSEYRSGCCGMAGSFGFEKEHYDLSMKVGELVLLPEVRKTPISSTIVAVGTSCRHQIMDGAGRTTLHPIEVMWEAFKEQ